MKVSETIRNHIANAVETVTEQCDPILRMHIVAIIAYTITKGEELKLGKRAEDKEFITNLVADEILRFCESLNGEEIESPATHATLKNNKKIK